MVLQLGIFMLVLFLITNFIYMVGLKQIKFITMSYIVLILKQVPGLLLNQKRIRYPDAVQGM